MGETQATKEAVWLRSLLTELHANRSQTQATIIFGDNQGAIALTKNPQFHDRTKHIDIQHHFVREKQDKGLVDICYISSADGLTKALPRCFPTLPNRPRPRKIDYQGKLNIQSAPTRSGSRSPQVPKGEEDMGLRSSLSYYKVQFHVEELDR
jgi:hypothetical protein